MQSLFWSVSLFRSQNFLRAARVGVSEVVLGRPLQRGWSPGNKPCD